MGIKAKKVRLDLLVCERGLAESRARAQALILAGKVWSGTQRLAKCGTLVAFDTPVEVQGPEHPFASRGGVKLRDALAHFGICPQGRIALDIGASTGGFTDCLLQQGARQVHALDVGYGQLAWRLRQDPRVVVWERTNIRNLASQALQTRVSLVVVDVSFIRLQQVLPHAGRFLAPGGLVLALVKPQFEAGRQQVGKGGLVRDPQVHQDVVQRVLACGAGLGWQALGWQRSTLPGKKSGNLEFFAHWQAPLQPDAGDAPRPPGSGTAASST